jgi:type I restriction enzyme S subunit
MIVAKRTYHTPWTSHIPGHWDMLRVKSIFTEIDDRSEDGSEELLSVSHYTGVTKKRDALANEDDYISNAKTLVGYKKVAQNDLVSNIMLAWNGSLGISKYDGITSPAYCVYRIKGDNNPDYYGHLFSTAIMKAEFRRRSYGIIDSRLRLYSDKFFSIPVPLPPKTEQDAVVDYIREKSIKIKHFIKKKKQFIELLKEQRQAVINKAVTKGINPSAKLKKSGIEWLGEIPEHWRCRRLRYCGTVQNGLNKGGEYFGKGFPFFGYGDIYNNENLPEIPEGLVESNNNDQSNCSVQKGDVFFTRTSEVVEEIAMASTCKSTVEKATFSGFLIRFRPNGNLITAEYSTYFFRSQILRNYFVKEMNIMTRASLSQDTLKNLWVLIPPDNEQLQIADYIKTETTKLDEAIKKAEKEIDLIKEYKEAMIAEAVFGKLSATEHTKLEMENAK